MKTKYRVRYYTRKYGVPTIFTLQKRKWLFFWETIYQTSSPQAMRHCIDSYGLDYK